MLDEEQSARERGSKSFKTQFEALFDKTFNIFIANGKVFPFFRSCSQFRLEQQRRERGGDKNFHLKISSRNERLS